MTTFASSSTHLRPRYIGTIPSNIVSPRASFEALGLANSYVKRPSGGKPVSRRANSGGSILLPAATAAYTTPFTPTPKSATGRPRSASFDRPSMKKKPLLGHSEVSVFFELDFPAKIGVPIHHLRSLARTHGHSHSSSSSGQRSFSRHWP